MSRISIPFGPEQVDALNQFQLGVSWCTPGYPVTCPHRGGSEDTLDEDAPPAGARITHGTQGGTAGVLVARASGWACPHCNHTQDWAHGFMAQLAPQALGDDSIAAFAALALRTQGRITDRQALLERINKAIDAYSKLFISHFVRESQSEQESEPITRATTVVPFMLASLRRRRMELMGVRCAAGQAPIADASWTRLSKEKPGDDTSVEVLYQDDTISNPLHDGFGCIAWIEIRRFYSGRILTTGAMPTHWREPVRLTL